MIYKKRGKRICKATIAYGLYAIHQLNQLGLAFALIQSASSASVRLPSASFKMVTMHMTDHRQSIPPHSKQGTASLL
jgi:hypothetical protein